MQRSAYNRATASGLTRRAQVIRGGLNKSNRTVEIALSSECPVERGAYVEVLSHSPSDVDLSRINGSAPFLLNHNMDCQIGVVEPGSARLGMDKTLRCTVRLGTSHQAEEIWQDILDGIRAHISVGYSHTAELSSQRDAQGREVVRFAWTPFEASSVAVPADTTVGVGRSHNFTINEPPPRKGLSLREFEAELEKIKQQRNMRTPQPARTKLFGLSEVDAAEFSIVRAIRDCVQGTGPTGFEREMLDEGRRQFPNMIEGQIFIPPDLMVGVNRNDPLFRDLTATSALGGGNMVQTTVLTPIVEILRNKMVCQRAGIQVLAGLQGNLAIPRQTGAATAYSLAEQAQVTKSTQTIGQIAMTPHRVGAWNTYTKQLMLQSSVDVENFVRDDLMKVLAIKMDRMILQGMGAAEPLGIKNTTGIGAVTFGGRATWTDVISFETQLALANADVGRMAYITAPEVRGMWKTVMKIAASTFPIFLWEAPASPDSEGTVNMYRAYSTNQIDGSQVVFGNWEDDIFGMWGGLDIVIDPYTSAQTASINVTVNAFVDNAVRHAASFAWSTDSAAQ